LKRKLGSMIERVQMDLGENNWTLHPKIISAQAAALLN